MSIKMMTMINESQRAETGTAAAAAAECIHGDGIHGNVMDYIRSES